jgi:uncharacterized membrane protein
MTQKEFLYQLELALRSHGVGKVSDILADYQEHFEAGLSKGKSENEIAEKLGNPVTIAKAYETEKLIEQVKNPDNGFQPHVALKVIGRLLILAPFNFLVLVIPGAVIFGLLTAGWSVAAALMAVGVSLPAAFFKVAGLGIWPLIALGSTGLGLLGMAFIVGLIMYAVTRVIFVAVINYLHWNLKFVLEK